MKTWVRMLATASTTMALAACGGSGPADAPSQAADASHVSTTGAPPAARNVPVISPEVSAAAGAINSDPRMRKIVDEWESAADAQHRYDTHLELTRIAGPSRYESRRAGAIRARLLGEWGFDAADIVTRDDGTLPGAGLQKVDGLPVYNVCARIKGSYAGTPGAKSYNGQYPKVLVEGHIDSVNPSVLPPADHPFEPVKLQSMADAVVSSPEELAALPEELHFDAKGRIIHDAVYERAYRRFDDADAAKKGNALRHYVPGYNDDMGNTMTVFQIARMMKKYDIQPVYDVWICGTAGEEGKGNLAGMKQLYGYNQDTGKGNNALNFVADFGVDGSPQGGTINFVGSYRFQIKYLAPAELLRKGGVGPSPVDAAAMAAARIAALKTPWDDDHGQPKTTYTVGTMACEPPLANGVTPSCTMLVDMRSPLLESLNAIRARIEPLFDAGMAQENERFHAAAGSPQAVTLKREWFGDRPPHTNANPSDVAIQAAWQAAEVVGADKRSELSPGSGSLNNNVPAAIGVPTINLGMFSTAASGGVHTFYEWGVPGSADKESKSMYRVMMAALIAAGFHTSDGKVIAPNAEPMGARTTEDQY